MKQRFLLALVFVCAFMVNSQAQVSKGAISLGGSIGINNQKSTQDTLEMKANSFNISPALGLVVKDNLVVGISFNYSHGKNKNINAQTEGDNNAYGVGIFVRQYIPIVSRLYFFGEAGANYTSSKFNSTTDYIAGKTKSKTKTSMASLGITPGISFAVTKKFHLESSFNNLFTAAYLKSKHTYTDASNKPTVTESEQFTAGLSSGGKVEFSVGCRFFL